jgi:HNH endonuclease
METARALTENLAALLRREHDALAEFLVALADFDRRRAWIELGHSSLFYFLHRELRLSKAAAQYRKVAAELIQEIPGIVEPLRRGELCLTSIIEAARVVTAQNWETVLPRFYGLSRREAMDVVAALQPHPAPPVRTVVTSVRSDPGSGRRPPVSQALALVEASEPMTPDPSGPAPAKISLMVSSPGEPGGASDAPVAPTVTPARPFEVVPLTADQSRVHLTVSKAFMRKLEAARDELSHAMPGATPAEILEAGLELLLAQAAKRKGLVEKPRKNTRPATEETTPAKAGHVPAHVRREVWIRDGGRCQWGLGSGGVCGSTRHLELDHIHPRSRGGASTADNLRILCRSHNDLAARLAFGDEKMDQFTLGLRGAPRSSRAGRASRIGLPATPPP